MRSDEAVVDEAMKDGSVVSPLLLYFSWLL